MIDTPTSLYFGIVFFVIRAKSNLQSRRICSRTVDAPRGSVALEPERHMERPVRTRTVGGAETEYALPKASITVIRGKVGVN